MTRKQLTRKLIKIDKQLSDFYQYTRCWKFMGDARSYILKARTFTEMAYQEMRVNEKLDCLRRVRQHKIYTGELEVTDADGVQTQKDLQ